MKFNASLSIDLGVVALEANADVIFYCAAVAPDNVAEITAGLKGLANVS